jgi:hypothetical protein
MPLLKRLKVQRTFFTAYHNALDSGQTAQDARDVAIDAVHREFGADIDLAKIIELIMLILSLLGL